MLCFEKLSSEVHPIAASMGGRWEAYDHTLTVRYLSFENSRCCLAQTPETRATNSNPEKTLKP